MMRIFFILLALAPVATAATGVDACVAHLARAPMDFHREERDVADVLAAFYTGSPEDWTTYAAIAPMARFGLSEAAPPRSEARNVWLRILGMQSRLALQGRRYERWRADGHSAEAAHRFAAALVTAEPPQSPRSRSLPKGVPKGFEEFAAAYARWAAEEEGRESDLFSVYLALLGTLPPHLDKNGMAR